MDSTYVAQAVDNVKQQSALKVAVVSFSSLGDSLLYVLMAHNLSINGFDTTYFGNVGYQLSEWVKETHVRPSLGMNEMHDVLDEYHVAFICPSGDMRQKMAEDAAYLDVLRKRYILICQKAPSTWIWDHTRQFQAKLMPALYERAKNFVNASGSIRLSLRGEQSVVGMLLEYMQMKLKLEKLTKMVTLSPPSNLKFRCHTNRVIVSPDSAGPVSKNWGEKQFLSLCNRLKKLGYDPKIVVSPANHQKWQRLAGKRYEVPLFNTIGELAAYIFESSSVVANDSGNGHLASFLNIPVVTIYQKRNPKFRWRPDWLPAKVVCPVMTLKLYRWRVWRPFVTVNMVITALLEALG